MWSPASLTRAFSVTSLLNVMPTSSFTGKFDPSIAQQQAEYRRKLAVKWMDIDIHAHKTNIDISSLCKTFEAMLQSLPFENALPVFTSFTLANIAGSTCEMDFEAIWWITHWFGAWFALKASTLNLNHTGNLRKLQMYHQLQRNQSYESQGFGTFASLEHGYLWYLLAHDERFHKLDVRHLTAELCEIPRVPHVDDRAYRMAHIECVHGIGHALFYRHATSPSYSVCTPFAPNGGGSNAISEDDLYYECNKNPISERFFCRAGALHSLAAYSNLTKYDKHFSKTVAYDVCRLPHRRWEDDLWRPLPPPPPSNYAKNVEFAQHADNMNPVVISAPFVTMAGILLTFFVSFKSAPHFLL